MALDVRGHLSRRQAGSLAGKTVNPEGEQSLTPSPAENSPKSRAAFEERIFPRQIQTLFLSSSNLDTAVFPFGQTRGKMML